MKQSQLVGIWSLLSYTGEDLSGRPLTIREHQFGRLEYMDNGKMRVEINRDVEWLRELNVDLGLEHISYSGRFEVDFELSEVSHLVECADRPERIGSRLKRTFSLKADRLIIRGQGLYCPVILEWQRVPQAKSYAPPHYISQQTMLANEMMRRFELATLISQTSSSLQISHLPLLLSDHDGHACFLGHMAKANPHWKILVENSHATVIFRGPDHYISPSWYEPSDHNVPTWNYAAVHLECSIEVVEGKEEALAILQKQVEWWERHLGTNWVLNPTLQPIQNLANGIVAFRVYPESSQLKFKLSQKQSLSDWQRVTRALEALTSEKAREVAKMMKETRDQ